MTRPSFEQIYMNMAHEVSRRSTCKRTSSTGDLMQVGCVIITPDFRKVISLGYNGNASGLANACDSTEPGACGCVHAETNAVVNCDVPRDTKKIVFCTHLPCVACAKLLINVGNVVKVFYANDYRIRTSLELFDRVGIVAQQLQSKTEENILISRLKEQSTQLHRALTDVQDRCNELFIENRRFRGVADEVFCYVCKRRETVPPKDGKFNEQLLRYRGWVQNADGQWLCDHEH